MAVDGTRGQVLAPGKLAEVGRRLAASCSPSCSRSPEIPVGVPDQDIGCCRHHRHRIGQLCPCELCCYLGIR